MSINASWCPDKQTVSDAISSLSNYCGPCEYTGTVDNAIDSVQENLKCPTCFQLINCSCGLGKQLYGPISLKITGFEFVQDFGTPFMKDGAANKVKDWINSTHRLFTGIEPDDDLFPRNPLLPYCLSRVVLRDPEDADLFERIGQSSNEGRVTIILERYYEPLFAITAWRVSIGITEATVAPEQNYAVTFQRGVLQNPDCHEYVSFDSNNTTVGFLRGNLNPDSRDYLDVSSLVGHILVPSPPTEKDPRLLQDKSISEYLSEVLDECCSCGISDTATTWANASADLGGVWVNDSNADGDTGGTYASIASGGSNDTLVSRYENLAPLPVASLKQDVDAQSLDVYYYLTSVVGLDVTLNIYVQNFNGADYLIHTNTQSGAGTIDKSTTPQTIDMSSYWKELLQIRTSNVKFEILFSNSTVGGEARIYKSKASADWIDMTGR